MRYAPGMMRRTWMMTVVALSILALAGCGSKTDRAQDIVPEVASIVDGSLTVSKSTDKAALAAARQAIKDSYDLKVEFVVLDKAAAARGVDTAARKRLAARGCSGSGSNFIQVALLKADYLAPAGNLGVALKDSKHPALVIVAGGDGKTIYESYPEEVIKSFNLRENQNVAASLKFTCKELKDTLAGKAPAAKPGVKANAAKGADGQAVGVPAAS
jgi:hypothetical protein